MSGSIQDITLRILLRSFERAERADLERLARDDSAGFFRALAQRPDFAGLRQLFAETDEPDGAQLRVLRGLRDVRGGG